MPKNVVITGANRGIGHAVARALVAAGHHVILACRDPAAADRARRELLGPGVASCVQASLDSIASIRAAGRAIEEACPVIDVLIHNAGVWPSRRELNEDGLERAFVTNHLAPFLLNHLLEERLAASRARVVQVSAGIYVKGRVDVERTPRGDDFSAIRTYADTKLCNLLLMPYFAERFRARGVTLNAVHPGVIRTGLGDRADAVGVLLRIVKRFWKEPAAGAEPIVRLALATELAGVTGRYFDVNTERALQPVAQDRELARVLIEQARAVCGLGTLESDSHAQSEAGAR